MSHMNGSEPIGKFDLRYVPYTGAIGNVDLGSFDLTTTGNITTPKINPTASQDLNLFGDVDVGDEEDGKSLIINRKAAEFDSTLTFEIASAGQGRVLADRHLVLDTATGQEVRIQHDHNGNIRLGSSYLGFGTNQFVTQYGYITADTASKFIRWQVSDTDDYFHLTREDSYVLGFKIEMPVDLVDNDLTTTGTITGGDITAQDRDVLRYILLNS